MDRHPPIWSAKVDRASLGAALLLHAALIAVFFVGWERQAQVTRETRMTVSLASEVSLENAGPQIVRESRAAIAPSLSETPQIEAAPLESPPAQRPVTLEPAPAPQPQRAAPQPRAPAPSRDRSRPDRRTQTTPPPAAAPARQTSGSRIGEDFLSGQGDSTSTDETRAPAATFGRAERAALSSAITRQLRPHWNAPTGVDAEKLVSIVSWQLNPDGSLKGRPTCQTQASSITDSNKPQASLHCERAIRAVQLAAPFNLPEQFYNRWNDLEWQFDRRL
ncbi:MAG: energy transducer TonB [Erythrobacter sp.]|jgi:hypothetical protein|nr:energy transducer TonB [Erythrobacter sp.]